MMQIINALAQSLKWTLLEMHIKSIQVYIAACYYVL